MNVSSILVRFGLGLLAAFLLYVPAAAQPCSTYFLFQQGAEFELQTFDAKDKPTGRIVYKILDVSDQGGVTEARVRMEPFDKKDKPGSAVEYTAQCRDGNFYVEMRRFLDPDMMKAYKDMEVRAEASYLEVPGTLSVGSTLPDGSLEADVLNGEQTMANVMVAVTNRKVEAMEPVTTPAGSFEAYKISSDLELGTRTFGIKMPSMKMSTAEWYAKDVGVVRSETYRKGKLVGYSVLTRLQK